MAQSEAYERPVALAAALQRLARGPCRILAGGTDLYPATQRHGLAGEILDVSGLADLEGLTIDGAGLHIGAGVRWSAIACADLPPSLAGLQMAAREVGGRQIQNAGTIGGNLCNASPAADGVPPLLTLAAEVELASLRGRRRLPLAAFILGPRRVDLAPDELMVAIHLPRSRLGGRADFAKLGARRYLVISIASVAVWLSEREGCVADAAVAVGACSAVPVRLAAVEAALCDGDVARAAGRVRDADVAAALSPVDDLRATADYRMQAAAELVRRAVGRLTAGWPAHA